MTIIAFHTPTLDVRGTCISIYDYAHFNEKLLGNKSIIVVPYSSITERKNDQIIIEKFVQRFELFFYNDLHDLENYIKNCDILYCIKYGTLDEIISKKIKRHLCPFGSFRLENGCWLWLRPVLLVLVYLC